MTREINTEQPAGAPSVRRPPRILVVDDDQELLGFMVEFFQFKGYDCDSAPDGFQALAKLDAGSYQLLVTDVAMPGMDGIELIRQANVRWPSLPKIILSGEGQFKDALAAIGEAVSHYFTKPIRDFEEFDRVVRKTIERGAATFLSPSLSPLSKSATGMSPLPNQSRSAAQAETERREKHYRTLLENGNDSIILLDANGRITDINQNACRLIGLSRRELLGVLVEDELPTPELCLFFHQVREAARQAAESRYETEVPRPDGSKRQVDVFSIAVMGAETPEQVIYVRDVSDYHRRLVALKTRVGQLLAALSDHGQAVRLNAGTLNNFMETANAFVFIADGEGDVLEWNPVAERMTGIPRREATSAGTLERVFVNFTQQVKPLLDRDVIGAGRCFENIETLILAADGQPRVLSWNISPVREVGKVVGAIAVGIDVTAEHRLRRELESHALQLEGLVKERTRELLQSQERFKNLFERVRDAIFAAGPGGNLLEVNPAWLKLLGYTTRSEVIGRHFLSDFAAEPEEAESLLTTLATRYYVQDHLLQLKRKDGTTVTALLTVSSQPAFGHESTAFEGIIRDITRLKQLEQKLIEYSQNLEELVRERSAELSRSEAKLRRLTDNSPDIIYRTDIRTMRFDHISPAAEAITGFSVEELRQMGPDGFVSRIHPKEAPLLLDLWAKFGSGETGDRTEFRYEYRFIRADGEIIWLADHGVIVRTADGELIAVEGVMHDVTTQKSAAVHLAEHASLLEQEVARRTTALAESEYRYRMLLSEAGDIIFTCDADGKLSEMNRRGEDLLDRSISDINANGFAKLLDEASRRRFNKALQSCFKAGIKPEPFQIEYVCPRGRKLLLEIQSSPLVINDRVVLVLQVARDLTARRRAAQAIRKLKEFNEGIISSMSEGIFIENDEGVCEFVNPAMAEMLGYKQAEIEGRHYLEFIAPSEREFVMNQSEVRRLRGFARYETRLVAITGEEAPVHISSRSRFEGDRAIGSLSVITDLRQSKEMERRQRFMERLLADERKLADIGMLAAGIAHNISSPLMVISGYAQLLRSKLPKVKEFDVILGQIDKISEITRNMMVKSRSEQDKGVKPIDLNGLLQTELKFLEANLHFKSKVEKQYHFDPMIPKLNGVYSDFSQAFSNIINNALDAMFSRPVRRLTVTSKQTPGEIHIEFGDTGVGIPPDHLSRIFDPFFTTKPPVGDVKESEPTGTGLGLSTAQQLVAHYGGRIEVESEPGLGTTFRIVIPISGETTNGSFAPDSQRAEVDATLPA